MPYLSAFRLTDDKLKTYRDISLYLNYMYTK